MAYRTQAFGYTTRILSLLLLMAALAFSLTHHNLYFTTAGLAILTMGLAWNLYNYILKDQRRLTDFLAKMEANDFSQSSELNKSDDALKAVLTRISQRFASEITNRETQFQYLQNIINHIQVAIICFGPDNKTDLINPAALKLLQLHHLNNLAALGAKHSNLGIYVQGCKSSNSQCLVLENHEAKPEVLINVSLFKLKGMEYRLVSILDVSEHLIKRELQSWKNLIRVLNHEIVNSVAPILSLSTSNHRAIEHEIKNGNQSQVLHDLAESLDAIERRSKDLLRMVEDFRSFVSAPIPSPELFCLNQLASEVINFVKPSIEKWEINLQLKPALLPLRIFADRGMVERMLINLIMNSIDAVLGQTIRMIFVEIQSTNGWAELSVKDTGSGIPEDIADKIFIPFFTTKEKGSGIGLSVCRELTQLNNGHIAHIQQLGWGCCFMVKFPMAEV
jgi:signal transduction histidine kinase